MTELQSLLQNSDTVVLKQLFTVVNESFRSNGGIYNFIKTVGCGIAKILVSLVVQHLFKNSTAGNGLVRFILFRLIYNRIILKHENKRDGFILDLFKTSPPTSSLPVYMEKEEFGNTLYYLPYIHSDFIKTILDKADKYMQNGILTICKDTAGRSFVPLDLFPSNNYKKLDRIIFNYFEVYNATKMVTPPIIVLQSKPGLGKSHSAHYLAKLNKYSEIRIIDLTGMVNKSFSSIITEIMSKQSIGTTIIYFDELDKYVDMYTQHTYTSQKSGPERKTEASMDEIVDSDYLVFKCAVKKSVLMNIAQLNNNFTNFSQGIIFIFCANNFHTLFADIDKIHIESIKSRFTFIDFKELSVMNFLNM